MSITPDSGPGQPTRRGRPSALILAALVAALGLAVVINATTGSEEAVPTSTTEPLAIPETPTTTHPVEVAATPLAALVPDFTGTLYAIEGSSEFELVSWPSRLSVLTRTDLPEAWPTELELDATGDRLALLLQGGAEGGSGLYEGSVMGLRNLGSDITSFAWHQTEPGRLLVVAAESDAAGAELLMVGFDQFDSPAIVPVLSGLSVYDAVLAWGDWGVLLRRYEEALDDNLIVLFDASGTEVWAKKAHWAYATPSGDILLSFYDNEIREFRFIASDGAGDEPGIWAELPSLGVTGISWSPGGEQLAVTVNQGGEQAFRLDLYDPEGGLIESVGFDWRVWDVEWTPDGRFIVMPASNLPEGYAVLFYDTETAALIPVAVEGAIRSLAVQQ